MSDIKKGDRVILKSGGPIMTVQDLGDYTMEGFEDGANCVWFDGNQPLERVFDIDSIKAYEGDW